MVGLIGNSRAAVSSLNDLSQLIETIKLVGNPSEVKKRIDALLEAHQEHDKKVDEVRQAIRDIDVASASAAKKTEAGLLAVDGAHKALAVREADVAARESDLEQRREAFAAAGAEAAAKLESDRAVFCEVVKRKDAELEVARLALESNKRAHAAAVADLAEKVADLAKRVAAADAAFGRTKDDLNAKSQSLVIREDSLNKREQDIVTRAAEIETKMATLRNIIG